MDIFVKYSHDTTDRTITLKVKASDIIRSVKAKIESEEGIPADSQQLKFKGIQLEDDHTLSYYNIEERSMLYLEGLKKIT